MTTQWDTQIVKLVLNHFPEVLAVYRYGSYSTGEYHCRSDLDLALLLPPLQDSGYLYLHPLHSDFELLTGTPVDLVNLRKVSTLLQKEIVEKGKRIYTKNAFECEMFELLVLSLYQKLQEERAEIVREGLETGRFYNV